MTTDLKDEKPADQSGKAITALDLPAMDPMPEDIAKYLGICDEKLGLVPNVLAAHTFDENVLS